MHFVENVRPNVRAMVRPWKGIHDDEEAPATAQHALLLEVHSSLGPGLGSLLIIPF